MKITDIRLRKIIPNGKLKAIVSITIDDIFAVHDIKIIEGPQRLFIAMPSKKDETGVYRDIVHPITAHARSILEKAIIDTYNAAVAKMENYGGEIKNKEQIDLDSLKMESAVLQ